MNNSRSQIMIKRSDASSCSAKIAFILSIHPLTTEWIIVGNSIGDKLITLDYKCSITDFSNLETSPVGILVNYIIKCLKTPLNYTISCNFGLEEAQATKENIMEYVTFLSRTSRSDITPIKSKV